jgi:hypothetical protein
VYVIFRRMDSTRIADLPENITMSQPAANMYGANDAHYSNGGGPRNGGQGLPPVQMPQYPPSAHDMSNGPNGMPNTNYMQMNVHPNPYGNGPPQLDTFGLPQQTHTTRPSNNPYISHSEQPAHMSHLPQHPLPSRDIPQDTTTYSNDERVVPNYIPAPKITSEFVKEYEDNHSKQNAHIKQHKQVIRSFETILLEFRAAVIVALLFLVFQSAELNRMMFKTLSFLGLYGSDGNINMSGRVVKSALFGAAYYLLNKVIEYVR